MLSATATNSALGVHVPGYLVQTGERIRKALRASACSLSGRGQLPPAECRPGMNPEQLLKNADSALYQAKEERG